MVHTIESKSYPSARATACPFSRIQHILYGVWANFHQFSRFDRFAFRVLAAEVIAVQTLATKLLGQRVCGAVGHILRSIWFDRISIVSQQLVRRKLYDCILPQLAQTWEFPQELSATYAPDSDQEEAINGVLTQTLERLEGVGIDPAMVVSMTLGACQYLETAWQAQNADPKTARISKKIDTLGGLSVGKNLQIVAIATCQTIWVCLEGYELYKNSTTSKKDTQHQNNAVEDDLYQITKLVQRIGMYLAQYPAEESHVLQNILWPSHLEFIRDTQWRLKINVNWQQVAQEAVGALDILLRGDLAEIESSHTTQVVRQVLAPFSSVLGKRMNIGGCPAFFTKWPHGRSNLASVVSYDITTAYMHTLQPHLVRHFKTEDEAI